MGIWIELGVFMLVFVFAAHQMHDLKKEKKKRMAAQVREREEEMQKAIQKPIKNEKEGGE